MSLTPVPKPFPTSLETLKSLIQERLDAMDACDSKIDAIKAEKDGYREEVSDLQNAAKLQLGITPREKKEKATRDPVTGEKIK